VEAAGVSWACFLNMKWINFTEVKFKLHLQLTFDMQACRVLYCLRSFSVARKDVRRRQKIKNLWWG